MTHSWGDTTQDTSTTQIDSSRERREQQSTSTNISQMYNLLTGYHTGTNRAVFLMLSRPHTLQPTDHRTFVQGLRFIEGVQEFFLVISRSKEISGLCIEASLETGHFPEGLKVEEPPIEYDHKWEDFLVTAYVPDGVDDYTKSLEDFANSKYTIESGWVIDRDHVDSDPGHPGLHFIGQIKGKPLLGHNY